MEKEELRELLMEVETVLKVETDGDGEDVTQLLSNTKDGAQITFFHEKLKTLNFTY